MLSYEKTIYHAVIIGCIVLAIIIGLFIFSAAEQHRKNIRLQRSYFLNEIDILEKERSRIASELHDGFASSLLVIRLALLRLNVNEEEQKLVANANQQLEQLTGQLSQIIQNLRPKMLDKKGLGFVLHHYFDNIRLVSGLDCEFNYKLIHDIKPPADIHIYRIVQEIVQNTVKHARASHFRMELKERKRILYIISQDNGIGFNTNNITTEGLGLRSIRSRIKMLGGELQCTSSPEKGTEYFCEIPI
jgi:signal transduction histidine kinase